METVTGKTVLVTGAAGSIGSELCRQVLKHGPHKLIMFDSCELALYNIDRELAGPNVVSVLGDCSDDEDSRAAFGRRVNTVYHAAAYKHVTMCERNRRAAERVNVDGTKMTVTRAKALGVQTLVVISSDKAVHPACWMGKTKAKAETVARKAGYCAVRFCNVAGSSGSVIPLFKEQIAKGLPVTVTDAEATRYFISIEDAARLVIEAGALSKGGETFVLEAGKPIKIVDLARELGATEIKFIGLRPGEKLHEELYAGKPVATTNPRIFVDGA